jgi:hypothetical protein
MIAIPRNKPSLSLRLNATSRHLEHDSSDIDNVTGRRQPTCQPHDTGLSVESLMRKAASPSP